MRPYIKGSTGQVGIKVRWNQSKSEVSFFTNVWAEPDKWDSDLLRAKKGTTHYVRNMKYTYLEINEAIAEYRQEIEGVFLDETADVKTAGGMTNFLKTIDMRPEINAIAQVEGTYSQQTGIATWTFTSLDPMTMEPTDDLMQGILPVNYNGTSGIGEVMFEVGVKPNKGDGTQIPNRAGIVFDYEKPILTPTWVNIVDATAPESHVTDVKMLNASTATVSISATDELSGCYRYDVYVQYGKGSSWFKAAENVRIDTTAYVRIYDGIDHGFYVLVTDSAGNVEKKEAVREFSLVVGEPNETVGDANGDETVNAADIVAILNYLTGRPNEKFILGNADVNGDGKVNIADVISITNRIMTNATRKRRAVYGRKD